MKMNITLNLVVESGNEMKDESEFLRNLMFGNIHNFRRQYAQEVNREVTEEDEYLEEDYIFAEHFEVEKFSVDIKEFVPEPQTEQEILRHRHQELVTNQITLHRDFAKLEFMKTSDPEEYKELKVQMESMSDAMTKEKNDIQESLRQLAKNQLKNEFLKKHIADHNATI